MTGASKYTIWTVVFYAVVLPLIPVFDRYSPGGPCTPGFGFLFIGLVFLSAIGGLVTSLAARLRGNKAFSGPLFVNMIALALLYLLVVCNWI